MMLWIYGKLLSYAVRRDHFKMFHMLCELRYFNAAYIKKETEKIKQIDLPELTEEQSQRIYLWAMQEIEKRG